MKKFQPALYNSPIDLPEGVSGKVSIVHRTIEEKVPVIGMRQAILRGLCPTTGVLAAPRRIHELREEGQGVWMTDQPEELNQIAEMMATVDPRGDVLVGGLGLGIVAATLATRVGMDRIVVVERSADVIKLCHPPLREPDPDDYEVVRADVLAYLLDSATPRFDFYLLDTWQGTSESTWWEEVMPLKRAIRKRWGGDPIIHCWAEDIMDGQIQRAVACGNRTWYYECLPEVMSPASIKRFTRDVGRPEWEKRYGAALDDYIALKAKTLRERGSLEAV